MNNDYSIKKKYAEQKYQLGINYYENGVEKVKKMALCDVPMIVDDKEITIGELVREYRLTKAKADRLDVVEQQINILKQSVSELINTLKGAI